MKRALALLVVPALISATSFEYRRALPGYRFQFPRDHFSHPDFQTEWWYYTGNLNAADGHRYGFELTFFRQAVQRGAVRTSLWDIDDAWLAHLALSDIDGGTFRHWQRLNRSGPGIAGASAESARVWNGNWQVRWNGNRQELQAITHDVTLRLSMESHKASVIHGRNGVSQKSAGAGNASHYISFTRLIAAGTLEQNGRKIALSGTAWMDHEFFTHQLAPDQTGWDWLSLQFDDNTELMLFRLRRNDGSVDPYSAGTFVDASGRARNLTSAEFSMTPAGGKYDVYPIEWRVDVASLGIHVSVITRLAAQELTGKTAKSPSYWEGAIEVSGTRAGVGYLEMTGYRNPGKPVL